MNKNGYNIAINYLRDLKSVHTMYNLYIQENVKYYIKNKDTLFLNK